MLRTPITRSPRILGAQIPTPQGNTGFFRLSATDQFNVTFVSQVFDLSNGQNRVDAIAQTEKRLGRDVPFLACAKEIAYCHPEKWDGSGYPRGLAGEAIPVSARLMALADVYDALISRRVYKESMSHEQATAIIAEGRGRHFDPDMVDAYLEIQEKFRAIAAEFADTDADLQQEINRLEWIAE